MHDCGCGCGQACDCDGEDHGQPTPATCLTIGCDLCGKSCDDCVCDEGDW